MKKHTKLTPDERDLIAVWRSESISIREISNRLGRSPSTISRELTRNKRGEHYVAIHAQARSAERITKARSRHPLKNKSVYKFVLKKLRCGWSPEQIAGRLKLIHPNNPYWHIHHETIYRFVYDPKNKDKALWEYLPRKQKRRRTKYGRKAQKEHIPDRVSIHDRPKEIEDRLVFGHWEGDSMVGKYHKSGIHTQVERTSRLIQARFIPSFEAEETKEAQNRIFSTLPKMAKKTTTVDNGLEFAAHKDFNLPVYFADPYSSWQRGTNEYHNGLIRRYLPKGTDFRTVTQEELDDIIEEINTRPRKCLGWYTAQEVFNKHLGVAIQSRM